MLEKQVGLKNDTLVFPHFGQSDNITADLTLQHNLASNTDHHKISFLIVFVFFCAMNGLTPSFVCTPAFLLAEIETRIVCLRLTQELLSKFANTQNKSLEYIRRKCGKIVENNVCG